MAVPYSGSWKVPLWLAVPVCEVVVDDTPPVCPESWDDPEHAGASNAQAVKTTNFLTIWAFFLSGGTPTRAGTCTPYAVERRGRPQRAIRRRSPCESPRHLTGAHTAHTARVYGQAAIATEDSGAARPDTPRTRRPPR